MTLLAIPQEPGSDGGPDQAKDDDDFHAPDMGARTVMYKPQPQVNYYASI
jgi:hypothetical protein